MWQRFTERARKVVFYAQQEAEKFGGGYVSTEHLLLGLIREDDSIATRVLKMLGISLDRIRSEVEKMLPHGDAKSIPEMTLTPQAKRVIDIAFHESLNLQNNYIGTEHLLLGLIRERKGLAGRVLAKFGANLEQARSETVVFQDRDLSSRPPLPAHQRSLFPGTDWRAVCSPSKDVEAPVFECIVYSMRTISTKKGDRRIRVAGAKPLEHRKNMDLQTAVDLGLFLREKGGQVRGFPRYELSERTRIRLEIEYPTKA